MTYLNNFIHYFINIIYINPKNVFTCIIFFIFFILIVIIYKILFYKKVTRDLKIYNFTLNSFYIILYVINFVILLLCLRYLRWGYILNLVLLYNDIYDLYIKIPLILFIDIILLLILFFCIIIKIKQFLNLEILKRHLYYYYYSHLYSTKDFMEKNPGKTFLTPKDYRLYVRICQNLENKYNYLIYIRKFVVDYILIPYCYLFSKNSFPGNLKKYAIFFFKHIFKILFIMLFIVDCIYYNYNIHLIFYYLPFYFIFHLWVAMSTFLMKTSDSMNNIIYERYYEEVNIKYIETSDEEDAFIFKYIEGLCECLTYRIKSTKDFDSDWEKKEIIYDFPNIFIYNRRYVRVKNTNVFRNYFTGEEVLEENLTEIPLK